MVLDLHCISFIFYHSLSGILVIYFINIIISIITITCIIIINIITIIFIFVYTM